MSKNLLLASAALLALSAGTPSANALTVSKSKLAWYMGKTATTQPVSKKSSVKPTSDETVAKAYGIRYGSDVSTSIDFVSFDVTTPGEISTEYTFPFTAVRAATGNEGLYYIIDSSDGLTSNAFYKFDIDSHELVKVTEYGLWSAEKALLFTDMTYDNTTGKIYALAFNIEGAEIDGEEIDAPYGLYTIDPSTGSATLIGYQELAYLVTLAASPDGELFSIDDQGVLWIVSKRNGSPSYDLSYSTDIPKSLQSMAFDKDNNVLYWSGFSVSDEQGQGFFSKFDITEDGAWYSKIGATQDNAEVIGLYIDSNPLSASAPAGVSGLTVTPAAGGASQATLSWTNPTTTIKGGALASTALTIKISRNGELVATLEGQTAGEAATWTDNDVRGNVTYSIVAVNADGEEGRTVYADPVYVGTDVPGAAQNVTATKAQDSYAVTLTWEAPAAGKNGGWYDTETVKYDVLRMPDVEYVASDLTELTFTDNSITETAGYYYTITAKNSAGRGASAQSPVVVSGPALEVPYSCNFANDRQINLWTVIDADNDGQTFAHESNYAGTTNHFMKYFPDNELTPDKTTNDWLISAPIHLEAGQLYAVRYSLRIQLPTLFPASYTVALGKGATPESMTQTIVALDKDKNEGSQEFVDHLYTFTVEESGDYNLGFNARNAVMQQYTNIVVEEILPVDIEAVSLSGEVAPIVGTANNYTVTVKNNGALGVNPYTVQLVDADNTVLAQKQVTAGIAPQKTAEVTVEWTPTTEGAKQVSARVIATADGDASNDVTEATTVTVLKEGQWVDILPGDYEGGSNPFFLTYPYSAIQTIYTKDQVGGTEGNIEAMAYYYTLWNNNPSGTFKAGIALTNTQVEGFDEENPQPITIDQFTQVLDADVELPVGASKWLILFDEPFKYTGNNLCVFTTQENEGDNYVVRWKSYYSYEDPVFRVIRYRGYEPYDYSQSVTSFQEQANVSFFFAKDATGINDLAIDDVDLVVLSGNFTQAAVYDTAGKCVVRCNDGKSLDLTSLPTGIYIVQGKTAAGKVVSKKVAVK